MVGCWRGYLSGARCRLAYVPADATALTVSCFSKIQIGFTFLVLAHLGSPGKGPLNGCVCVCVIHRMMGVDGRSQLVAQLGGLMLDFSLHLALQLTTTIKQEAQLSPRDRAMRRVN